MVLTAHNHHTALKMPSSLDAVAASARLAVLHYRKRLYCLLQICLAMHHVHAAGVLHRDLKTSNILANKPSASTPASPAPGRSEAPTPTEFAALPLLKLADFGEPHTNCTGPAVQCLAVQCQWQ